MIGPVLGKWACCYVFGYSSHQLKGKRSGFLSSTLSLLSAPEVTYLPSTAFLGCSRRRQCRILPTTGLGAFDSYHQLMCQGGKRGSISRRRSRARSSSKDLTYDASIKAVTEKVAVNPEGNQLKVPGEREEGSDCLP